MADQHKILDNTVFAKKKAATPEIGAAAPSVSQDRSGGFLFRGRLFLQPGRDFFQSTFEHLVDSSIEAHTRHSLERDQTIEPERFLV